MEKYEKIFKEGQYYNYYYNELTNIMPLNSDDIINFQFSSVEGKTKFMTLNKESAQAVINFCTTYLKKKN